ncbi:hypothetical protein ASPVEDRAFT_36875 [Aspergillus versicolor CBS 583.65]|uniref:C2H2-type domain-containing protein n=1 Tax=Aspergillus versicolor CBS 583.65 TaxID=1036611 RepID=A0A1L9P7I1_ASPVE|nr:uncharacterized protein ASPVEDRAFT_36875 [Aspergillus versicolor CBS 583.65]OJI97462.1 hypothetical protein ASPVEDRAFT_36875 [Aspergillus versicolor CBS 583.65]
MEWPVSRPQPTGNGNSINPFLLNQHVFSIPNNDAGAQVTLAGPNDIAQDRGMPIFSGVNINSSPSIKSPCIRHSATSDSGQTRVVPLEVSTYYPPPSTPFAPALRYSMDVRPMEDVVANQPNTAGNTSEGHLSESAPSPPYFRCKWEDCTSTRHFSRVGDLIRHIKSIHIAPNAYPCRAQDCGKAFGRPDHLQEHTRRCHQVR